jgi:hypothetical protein
MGSIWIENTPGFLILLALSLVCVIVLAVIVVIGILLKTLLLPFHYIFKPTDSWDSPYEFIFEWLDEC